MQLGMDTNFEPSEEEQTAHAGLDKIKGARILQPKMWNEVSIPTFARGP